MPDYPDTCANGIHGYQTTLLGKHGLEIGGPSPVFTHLGVYSSAASLDNVIFSPRTLWSEHSPNSDYVFPGKINPGRVYIADVVDLHIFQDESYDFVFASHVLEHLVNPLNGLKEMTRVLRAGGLCILVLPWKNNTFDHRREVTPFSELLEHYNENRDEREVSDHLDDILKKHDLSRDPEAGTIEQFTQRCSSQFENRALHVHVFDFALMEACLRFFGYDILNTQLVNPFHQIMLGRLRRPLGRTTSAQDHDLRN